ncbi:MAG: RHS repeat protein, partial [Bacteroidales bacterium]|nr:RHS repeat protein [Bacteroidales bacterium]
MKLKTYRYNKILKNSYFGYSQKYSSPTFVIRDTGLILPEVNGQSPVYEYTYDAQGNQLTIKDPNENITKFTYDENGNQLTRTLPDGSTEY